jgi:hypothetical protein
LGQILSCESVDSFNEVFSDLNFQITYETLGNIYAIALCVVLCCVVLFSDELLCLTLIMCRREARY